MNKNKINSYTNKEIKECKSELDIPYTIKNTNNRYNEFYKIQERKYNKLLTDIEKYIHLRTDD